MYYIQVRNGFGIWYDLQEENPFETLAGASRAYWYWKRRKTGFILRVIDRSSGDNVEIASHKLLEFK